ncbi:unnamed protein product, partial [Candidula unifasciata]
PTHMSLGNGSSIITSSIPGLITQTANGNSKAQGNGSKGQNVQNQAQNATAAIASMVAKQPTIGVFSNQGNPGLGSNFVPQCTVSTHQGGLRLNQTQMVNSAGQIITSQPMQSILTNQAIMQAMASLQMQQGIPIATAAGHQQILNANQSQMPVNYTPLINLILCLYVCLQPQTIFAGQNFLIRAQGPLSTQPITMTSMQAAFAGIKPQQPQQQQQQMGKVRDSITNVSGKVMLPSVPRTPVTAKIQPSISQPAKLCIPAVPKTTKPRPKAVPKTATSSATAPSPSSSAAVRSIAAVAANTTSTTAVVTSLPVTTTMVSIATALPVQVPGSELAPPLLTRVPALPVAEVVTQTVQTKSPSDAEIKATVASSSSSSVSSAVPSLIAASSNDSSTLPKLSPALLGSKMTIDDIVLEEKPVISQVVKSSNSISAAMEAAGLVTLVKETKPVTLIEPSPIAQPPPVVEKQRAIVKPQILTHIIEGFVIQEGLEPFPVQQSSLLQEFIPPKASLQIVKESEEEGTSCDDEPPTLLSQVDDEHKHSSKLLKCELCQKVAPASTFNNSLRFCSVSCSRRHNVSHSRRAGLFKSRGTTRKRKHILGRKNWRVSKGGRLTYAKTSGDNNSNDDNNEDSNTAPVGDEMSSSNSTRETSSSADSPPRSQEYDMDVDGNIPRTDPGKWTVTEVYDFIQSMPGCREYAEEFRSQEIDGQALLLLKEDHLMTAMNIKLGPALKICSKINSLKNDNAPS